MKLRDIIKNVDKSESNSSYVNIEELSQEVSGIYYGYSEKENTRIKAFFFTKEQCTDTWVGWRVYFLDDEAVAISHQPYRKSSEEFEWISEALLKKTYDYIISLYEPETPRGSIIKPEDFDQDFGEGYKVEYGSRLLTNDVIYEPTKEKVVVTTVWREYKDIGDWHHVKIKFGDGQEKKVPVSEIIVPFSLKQLQHEH